MEIPDRDQPFHHIDRNTLTRVAPPRPNPLAGGGGRRPTAASASARSDRSRRPASTVQAMSELTWDGEPKLDRPILVVALAGLFDAASVATGAISWLVRQLHAEPLARIDAEPLLRLPRGPPARRADARGPAPGGVARARRPRHAHGGGRARSRAAVRAWSRTCGGARSPRSSSSWPTGAGVEMIVTLGASPAQTPHTRPPVVFGSSTNAELAARLGLSRPQYQGPTGVLGVLQAALDVTGPPAIAMRVGVPHYAMGDHDPKATMALLRHLEHVTGVATAHGKLVPEVTRWEERLSAAVADDAEARAYVEPARGALRHRDRTAGVVGRRSGRGAGALPARAARRQLTMRRLTRRPPRARRLHRSSRSRPRSVSVTAQVELRQPLRVGDGVDLHDPAAAHREPHDRHRPAARAPPPRRRRR